MENIQGQNDQSKYTDLDKNNIFEHLFDGDVLNIMLIINDAFLQRSSEVFNPRNNFYINKNDGNFNNAVNHQRDTIINTQTMIKLSRKNYSKENLEKIHAIVNS